MEQLMSAFLDGVIHSWVFYGFLVWLTIKAWWE